MKRMLKNYWPICLLSGMVILVMNYFCRVDDSDALLWILAPTAWWVRILGGVYFEYIPHQGYVNHLHHFLIAPACSGIRFMLLTFLMLVFFSGIHSRAGKGCWRKKSRRRWGTDRQLKRRWEEYLWIAFSAAFAYVSTVFVNGIRIVVSICFPPELEKRHLLDGWLTPDRLHTLIGAVLYFTFLCLIYLLAGRIRRKIFLPGGMFVPAFWYLLIVLALPLLKRMYHSNWEGFGQYAVLIVGVCLIVSIVLAGIRCFLLHFISK